MKRKLIRKMYRIFTLHYYQGEWPPDAWYRRTSTMVGYIARVRLTDPFIYEIVHSAAETILEVKGISKWQRYLNT